MALTTLQYTDGIGFVYDNALVNFTGTNAELLLGPDPQTFTEDFASDTGFTYDNTKAEFTGGLVQQKDVTPANSVFAVDYSGNVNPIVNEADLLWNKSGSLTAILTGLPTIVSGYIDCTADQGVAYAYTTNSIETHKFIYKPNYNVTPSGGNTNIIGSWNNTNNNDKFYLMGGASGGWRTHLYDSSGVQVFGLTAITAPTFTLGVDIEVEIVVDSTAGTFRVFADGILLSTQSPGAWTRGSIVSNVKMGNGIVYTESQASFDKYIYFTDAQHTANYTPGYTILQYLYAETIVELPTFSYSGLGSIVGYTSMDTVESSSAVRYIVNGLYWTGAMWASSDNSYDQSANAAQTSANLSSHTNVLDDVDVSVTFTGSNTQEDIDNLDFNYNGTAYPAEAEITSNTINSMDELQTFIETSVNPALTSIVHYLTVGGDKMWWDGAAWAVSDGTSAESNLASVINTNALALDMTGGRNVFVSTWLISDDGSATAQISALEYQFAFETPLLEEPLTTIAFGQIFKLDGTVAANSTLIVEYETAGVGSPYVAADGIVRPSRIFLATDSNGIVFSPLVSSDLYSGRRYKFTLQYTLTNSTSLSEELWGYASIPDQANVNLNTLTYFTAAV